MGIRLEQQFGAIGRFGRDDGEQRNSPTGVSAFFTKPRKRV
jgi:hypothetical protein